jgi:hypothetical protein
VIIDRQAKPTLTALEAHHGDSIRFARADGDVRVLDVLDSGAEIIETTLEAPGVEQPRGMTTYRFHADIRVDGEPVRLEREVGTQRSFYEPWEIGGVRIWLDAVEAIFAFMRETHGPCRPTYNAKHALPPRRQVRLAIQDASLGICPEPLAAWCPLPEGGLRIEDCYRGEDCWMGAYDGASAHGGLDINHPAGTPLYAPIDLDDQFLYDRVSAGANNNRWRATRHWPDGTVWILETAHMIELTVPEHAPLARGQQYARGAGVHVGCEEHSHFTFAALDHGELVRLDPWILFRQMYRDASAAPAGATRAPTEEEPSR